MSDKSIPEYFVPGQMSFGSWDEGLIEKGLDHINVPNLPGFGSQANATYVYMPPAYQAKRPPKKPRKAKNVVRNDTGECFEVVSSKAWGTTLIRCLDPQGGTVSPEDEDAFKQIKDFPRIPTDLWQRWVDLCFEFCPQGVASPANKVMDNRSLEVSCLLLRNEGDMRTWKIVVPKQVVAGAAVQADFSETVDIETGEKHDIFPPPGWLHAGSSHSHNNMKAFFSGTDDKFELGVPGLHIVLGEISQADGTYAHEASVVLRETRKIVEADDYVDLVPGDGDATPFHPNVLKMISKHVAQGKRKGKKSKGK